MSAEAKAAQERQEAVKEAQAALARGQEQENEIRAQLEAERRDELAATEEMRVADVYSQGFAVLVRRRELARARQEVLTPRLRRANEQVQDLGRTATRRAETAAALARTAAKEAAAPWTRIEK